MGKHFKQKNKKTIVSLWLVLLLFTAAASAAGGFLFLYQRGVCEKFFSIMKRNLPGLAINETSKATQPAEEHPREIFNDVLSEDIMKAKINELTKSKDSAGKSIRHSGQPQMDIAQMLKKTYKFDPPLLAVIVDDGGYNLELAKRAAALEIPLTWAIIPYLPYSKAAAAAAAAKQIPFLLHMPMQATADKDRSKYIIGKGMSPEEIKEDCEKALDSLNGAIGMNNHRGSLATTDEELMKHVAETLLERQLVFVDSSTTDKSIAQKTFLDAGVAALRNNGFLDNTPDKRAIAAQFKEAAKNAKRHGYAIVICHFRPATMMFLEELNKNKGKIPVKMVTIPELLINMLNYPAKEN